MAFFDKFNKDDLLAKAKQVTEASKQAVSKVADASKQAIGKVADSGKGAIKNMQEKLAYSEEEIAERKAKDGIVYVFDGGNGTLLEVYTDRVTICHNKSLYGSFAGFAGETVGEKTLYSSDLTSVEYKPAQKLCIGYIRFAVMGGSNVRKTTADAAEDPNAVAIAFVSKNEEAAEIKNYLEKMIRNAKSGTATPVSTTSTADELKKYKELLDMGAITQEEFDTKKKQLLGF